MPFRFFPLCCALLAAAPLRAQPDSIAFSARPDSAALVAAPRQAWVPAHLGHVLEAGSSGTLGEALAGQTAFLPRHYSPGGLASLSLRGMPAQHTAVLWQGFNIQSSMNGVQDMNLLASSLFEHIELRPGAASGLFGSGAIGGALLLQQRRPADGWGWQARYQHGDFGQRQASAALTWADGTWAVASRARLSRAAWDFPFRNLAQPQQPEQRLPNADVAQWDAQQDVYWQRGRHRAALWTWWQGSERGIPPSMSSLDNAARQWDAAQRLALEWQSVLGRAAVLHVRAAHLAEAIRYRQPGLDESSRARSWIAEAEWKRAFGSRHLLSAGGQHWHERARADAYAGKPQRRRWAAHLAWRYARPQWQALLTWRQEWADAQALPAVLHLEWAYAPQPHWRIWAKAGRSYRLPTFNDLYWAGQGQPDLRAEEGWAQGLGWQGTWQGAAWQHSYGAELFHQHMGDMIQWLPGSDGIWRPENLQAVRSYGIELRADVQRQWLRQTLRLRANYTYNRAEQARAANAANRGKQLIYTPEHRAVATLSYAFGPWGAAYAQQWTGPRFITASNTRRLPAFALADLRLWRDWARGRWRGSVELACQNCWGQAYQIVQYQAMPGRWWRIGLRIGQAPGGA